jgi:hypothetical protein
MLVFLTKIGEFVIATDNINEIADQGWFREFLQLHGPPRMEGPRSPQPAQQMRPANGYPQQAPQMSQMQQQVQYDMMQSRPSVARQVPASTFLEIQPDKMSRDVWESMTPEQQQQWMSRWGLQSGQ